MDPAPLLCPKCKVPLPAHALNSPGFELCRGCQTPVRAVVFPALYTPPAEGHAGEAVTVEGEAACFYHAQKKAVVPCDGCGRFLCSLCDVEFSGQHLCPSCLESGQKKGKLKSLENRRVAYDRLALALAVLPLLVWPFTLLTAPAAIFVALRHWKTPVSVVPRHVRLNYVLAISFAVIQIGLWAWAFYLIYAAMTKG